MSKENKQYFTLKNKMNLDSTLKSKLINFLGLDPNKVDLSKQAFKYTLINEEK